MRLGLFLNFEHGSESSVKAFERQIGLALYAEEQGLDALWVSEHHFTSFTQSGAILPLMAYLAGRTRRIRIGAAAVLLPLHNPIRLAEDLATIDILSHGRLDLGLARGGPFPSQYAHFHVEPESVRERSAEAMDLLLRLLREENVTFEGRWYQAKNLTIYPRLVQPDLPVFLASTNPEVVAEAARLRFGLMAGHAWPLSQISALSESYRAAAGCVPADFVVLRNICVADSDAKAQAAAIPAMERFQARMREHSDKPPVPLGRDQALETGIIGSQETCRRKLADLAEAAPHVSLVMKLACLDEVMAREVIARVREMVPRAPAILAAG
jgi:alkanesulfonate monooxygenase SsuD/methylene tetrahydromethanopterin reductase-like flavin-dependent oxidoreductase (luciferase family)